jgi:hypothetical protein
MSFDKKTELLVKEVELIGLSTQQVLGLFGVDDEDEVMGGRLDIGPEHVPALAPYAHGQLDLGIADWQLEARDPR